MAVILKGKHKGKDVRLHDFGKDWMVIEHPEVRTQDSVFNPTSLELTQEEIDRILASQHGGFLFSQFYLDGNRFKKRKGAR